jgi:arginine-tRNA-protein transferase
VPYEAKPGGHKYTVEITKAIFTQESFDVFCKYEKSIHNKDDKAPEGYKRFLCGSPLYDPADEFEASTLPSFGQDPDINREEDQKITGPFPQYGGSYHMLHRIDGELAFVGVLDYTNIGVSSVYLFYDPKWEFLSPGTLAALREIEHIRKSPRHELHWYYMGLYYQDC